MLVRYDLCRRAVRLLRTELKRLNGFTREAFVESAMATRPGMNRAKVRKLVDAIWEAEN